jgi:hypothetical protein
MRQWKPHEKRLAMVGRLLPLIVSLLLLIHAAGCNRESRSPPDGGSPLGAEDASAFGPISKGIADATSLTLFEGLPHQVWDMDQYQNELATKKTVRLHEYPFYERTLAVGKSDQEGLRRLSASAESYSSFSGEKSCGGYHPDFCLAWTDAGSRYELLICFGCQEMKLYGPTQSLRLDIRPDAAKSFRAILSQYRGQRPGNRIRLD